MISNAKCGAVSFVDKNPPAPGVYREDQVKPVDLRVIENDRAEERQEAMGVLTAVMDEVKSGEVVAVAVAVVYTDGSVSTVQSDTDDGPALLGAIAMLQHRMLRQLDSLD